MNRVRLFAGLMLLLLGGNGYLAAQQPAKPVPAPVPSPNPPIVQLPPILIPVHVDLYPDVYVATCDFATGEHECHQNGQTYSGGSWRLPSMYKEAGYQICTFDGGEYKHIGGHCDSWLEKSRDIISARCTSKNDGNIGGEGGFDYYRLGYVKLVYKTQVGGAQCKDPQTSPPPVDEEPEVRPVECQNGRLICTHFHHGISDGKPVACPPPYDRDCSDSAQKPGETR